VAGYILRWFTCQETVTYIRTDGAQHGVTMLIETNALVPSHSTSMLLLLSVTRPLSWQNRLLWILRIGMLALCRVLHAIKWHH